MGIEAHVDLLDWKPVDGSQRRWFAVSWHGTYSVFESLKSPGHWLIQFCDLYLAGAFDFNAAIAFAEWHNDYHRGAFDEARV